MNQTPDTQNPAGGRGVASELAPENAPLFYPTHPHDGTVRASVLTTLQSGRELTSLEAWAELGTSRLAAHVHALRRSGWPILAREVLVTCRAGRQARIASYRMQAARGAE